MSSNWAQAQLQRQVQCFHQPGCQKHPESCRAPVPHPVDGNPELQLKANPMLFANPKGWFFIKSCECSGKDRVSKYLGMTWDCKNDCYLLKFCLNLFKKFSGIQSEADFDAESLQDRSIPITKKKILSVVCQQTTDWQLLWCSLYILCSVRYAGITSAPWTLLCLTYVLTDSTQL